MNNSEINMVHLEWQYATINRSDNLKKIIIAIFCLTLCGCTNRSLLSKTEKLSDIIVDLHQNLDYDKSKLDSDDVDLIDQLIQKESITNKIIDISALDLFSDEARTDEPNTKGVYKENDKYFIKYSDLNFMYNEELNLNYATLYIDSYIVNILKDNVPILYYDTNNINYKYRYMRREKTSDEINYYYRSFGNGSMLTIKYILEKNKITDIKLIYDKYYVEKTAD